MLELASGSGDAAGGSGVWRYVGGDALSILAGRSLESENFNHALFALAFFSRRQDRELLGAISRGLLDCPYRA